MDDHGGIGHDVDLGTLVAVPAAGAVAADLELVVDEVGGAAGGGGRVLGHLVLVEEGDGRGGVGLEVGPRRAGLGHGVDVEPAAGDEEGLRPDVAAGGTAPVGVGVGREKGLGSGSRQHKLDGTVGLGDLGVGLDVQLALHVDGGGGDGQSGALGDGQLALDVEAGGTRQVEVAGSGGIDDVAFAARDDEGAAGREGEGQGGEVAAGGDVGQAGVAAQGLKVSPDGRHEAAGGRVGVHVGVVVGVNGVDGMLAVDQEAAGAHLVGPLQTAHLVRFHRGREGSGPGVHGRVGSRARGILGRRNDRRRQQGGILLKDGSSRSGGGGQDGLEGGRRTEEDGQGGEGPLEVHGWGNRLRSTRAVFSVSPGSYTKTNSQSVLARAKPVTVSERVLRERERGYGTRDTCQRADVAGRCVIGVVLG